MIVETGIMIFLMFLAVCLGVYIGICVSRIMHKKHKKKIEDEATEKIIKQDKKYVIDGKPYDLKKDIEKQQNENL